MQGGGRRSLPPPCSRALKSYTTGMSHAIYQTKALVLKTENSKESNKVVYLYTEKFGLVVAHMQSLRELRSKMRYHVHPLSLVVVDLVSGKNIWHITGVHEEKSSFVFAGTPWFRLLSLFSETLLRLCGPEEENKTLWYALEHLFQYIETSAEVNPFSEIEIVFLVESLAALGYWDEHDKFFSFEIYSKELFQYIQKYKKMYIKKINEALISSQL